MNGISFDQQHGDLRSTPEEHGDYGLLMSLSLDGMLDRNEESRLEAHLIACEECKQQWQRWQAIDRELEHAPLLLPRIDLVGSVQVRIERLEQQRRARVGILLAGFTLLLWLVGIAGVGFVLGFLVYNQVGWFGETLQWMSYTSTTLSIWAESIWQILVDLSGNPSTFGALLAYLALALGALSVWARFLQRSTQVLDSQPISMTHTSSRT